MVARAAASCKAKRNTGVVGEALKNIGESIGAGGGGEVFRVKGQPEALLKRVIAGATDTFGKTNAEKEVRNLMIVGQFLGWGVETGGKKNTYILMKHMGTPIEETKHTPAQLTEIVNKAAAEYKEMYGIEHKDDAPRNTVLDKQGKAHTIDWGRAAWASPKSKLTQDQFNKCTNVPAPEKLGGAMANIDCVVM